MLQVYFELLVVLIRAVLLRIYRVSRTQYSVVQTAKGVQNFFYIYIRGTLSGCACTDYVDGKSSGESAHLLAVAS